MKNLLTRVGVSGDRKEVLLSPMARQPMVSNATFWLYMYFLVENFLHFSSRVPVYGRFRPTLMLVVIISVMLIAQSSIIKKRGTNQVFNAILILLFYLIASLPLVEYAGSVIRANLPNFVKAIVFFLFHRLHYRFPTPI